MQSACETCRFWHMDLNWSREEGECHIRAPQVVPDADGGSPYAIWPPTRATGWCGEHEPKPTDNTTGTEQSAKYAAYLSSLNRGAFEICWTKRGEHQPKPIDNTTDTEGGA